MTGLNIGDIIHYVHVYEDRTKTDRFGIIVRKEQIRDRFFQYQIKWLRAPNKNNLEEHHHFHLREGCDEEDYYTWNMQDDIDWFYDSTLEELGAIKII